MKRILSLILVAIILSHPSVIPAGEKTEDKINVAVAANFIMPFQEITRSFTIKTGIRVEATYSSTGQLYAQIINGAPYDLFLSADRERPALLYKEGRAEVPFVYAVGQVVLWTTRKDLCREKDWRRVLATPGLRKIAIANPKTAPYGTAAMEALAKTDLKESVKGKLVFSQDIAQAFQYVSMNSVDAGFCALSAAVSEKGRTGCSFIIPEAPSITQSACVLVRTAQRDRTTEFVRFLSSPEAGIIKKKYGYQ
ncbi:MAG: molybdate ABC transporter substrate-binding protein [Syntrophales bacterium]|nr:molybdate ABC transporter substrate-binding protein [Syntrophales bacterium]